MSTWTNFVLNNVAEKMTPILQTPVEDIVYEILDRKGLPTRGEVKELKGRLDKLEQAVQGFSGSFDALKKDVAGAVERVAAAVSAARSAAEEAARAAAQAFLPGAKLGTAEPIERDQWTIYSTYRPHRPLLRIPVDDAAGSVL
ncbi:hypothetical protein L6R50_25765, partial [Myxococcota bacterium]|nr:hypothetical protein [Myxococcota bacterium]